MVGGFWYCKRHHRAAAVLSETRGRPMKWPKGVDKDPILGPIHKTMVRLGVRGIDLADMVTAHRSTLYKFLSGGPGNTTLIREILDALNLRIVPGTKGNDKC